jgi:YD repeat-containing protein
VFTYGAIAGDTGTGRLLKVTRAHPNAGESEEEIKKKLAEQKEAPKNTTLPTLSGSPVVGVSMGASSGVWSNGHVAYAYQWDDCNTEGKGCTPIPGAVNASYTAGSSDVGRTLVAQVQAIDSGGAVSASSAASGVVTSSGTKTEGERYPPGPGSTIEYRVPVYGTGAPYQMTNGEMAKWGQTNDLPKEATAIFPPDEPQGWPASGYKRATVLYMDERARTTNTASPSGAISTAEYNTLNEVTRTLSASDRAIAMKEGCESELKCKSAEVAKNLSNEKIYNSEGSQLLETFGPEHKIKLASGTEEETRDRQKFSYNEGAPSSGEKYNLVTKSSSWAENSAKLELDKHEAVTAYSNGAQGELGWTLRKPLLVAETVDGKTVTQSTKYSSETGAPVEDLTATTAAAPVYSLQFGALGSGAGQFKEVLGVAVDPSGYVWAVDKGDHRVEKFTSGGLFVAAYGAEGTIGGDYKETWGIAVNQSTGNVYVTDSSDSRVEELNSSGAFVEAIGWGVTDGKAELEVCKTGCQAGISGGGNGEFNDPTGIAVDTHGNLWVADNGNNRIEELSEAGAFVAKFGSYGIGNGQFNGLRGIAVSGGNIYVADKGNARIEELSPTGTYLNQFGGKGTGNGQFEGPEGISADPVTGDLYVTDAGNPVQEFSPGGMFVAKFGAKGSGNEQFKGPTGVAVAASGAIYVADTENNRAQEWEPVPASAPLVTSQFGSKGSGEAQFNEPRGVAIDSSGNLWVADTENSRLEKLSASGGFLAAYGSHGSGSGQFSGIAGVAINQSTGNIYVSDRHNMRIEEFSSSGAFVRAFGFGVSDGEIKFEVCASSCRAGLEGAGNGEFHTPLGLTIDQSSNVWVADYGNNRVQEFTAAGEFVAAYGTAGTGNVQFKNPEGIVYDDGNLYVTDTYNARVEEISTTGAYVGQFGSYGTGKGQFKRPSAIAVNSVTGNLYVGDKGSARVEEFTPAGAFLASFGTAGSGNGQIGLTEVIAPDEIAINASGSVYAVDTLNNRVEKWTPAPRPGNEGAKNTRTIYYSAAANTEYPGCGSHPEWANLVCQTEPDVQPGDNGPPQLPVTTTTYNMWDEPETVTEKIGSVTRTTKKTYDSAGRLAGNEETSTSSENATLPAVTDEYSTETGAMTKESETLEGKAKTITSAYNTLGQLVTYTDGEGATTKYAYDIDGRVEEVSEPMGRQVYAYDTTTGFMTKLLDTAAGTFTATYGVSGEMLTEGYPNGIMAKYTYNTIGQATNLEYEKTTHCTEKCVWFSDAEAFGAKGEVMSQASTLSAETYSYNEEGQLTQTQETPVGGKGCITRAYGYDEEGERTSLTTREPNEKGECTSEGGLVEEHAYDDVGRLLDPGVTYDALGNMTRVPTVDAGGQSITSTFYVDNQVATQEQAGKTIAYTYDPAGRTLLAKKGKLLTFSHYAGPGEALTWTCEEEEGKKECEEQKATKWTRNIPGIGGAIGAIQTNGETPLLQLHDLQGNIVATVADSETVTGLGPTFNSTEYGVSGENKTPKYAWLGANGAESELETGVITKAGATYVPQLARTIQTETVIPPGAAPNGVMATEAYVPPELPWANQSGNEAAANTVAQQRTQERETMEATCRANPASCTVEEDPGWVWVLTIKQAYIIANAIFSAKAAESTLNFVDDVDAALNQFAGIDFIAQIEVAVEEGVFGFSRDEVEKWGLDLAVGLSNCVWDADVQLGKPDDPHCWVYVPTKKYHIGFTIFGQFIGFIFEIPEFKKYTQVGYCPHGSSYCYAV